MPRPKTKSDEAVLSAALEVMARRGTAFTLSDVATAVELSRATLIQRFGDRETFLRRMAEHEVEQTRAWLECQPVDGGAAGLWTFLEAIISGMGDGDGFSARVVIAALEAQDPALRTLAGKRYALVQEAIALRLPIDCARKETAEHLHAVIAGATMQWVASAQTDDLTKHVLSRVRWALDRLSLWT